MYGMQPRGEWALRMVLFHPGLVLGFTWLADLAWLGHPMRAGAVSVACGVVLEAKGNLGFARVARAGAS
jgi:hypothetical protein